jgi:hypothetical protein
VSALVALRLAQFERVSKQIGAARRAGRAAELDFLLAQANVLFNALKRAVRP